MKKLSIIALLAFGMFYTSCEDASEIIQPGEFSESATFQNVDDIENFLDGIYANVTITPQIAVSSIFTDEVGIGSSNAGQNLDLYSYFLTNNDATSSTMWLNQYRVINYVNRLIRGAARVTPGEGETERYNSLIAEAKVLRAWSNFQLLAFYAEDMQNDASLGVILLDHVPTFEEQLPRSTTGEVFQFIETDLAEAEADLVTRSTLVSPSAAYYYVSHNMINAMRARMYAYRGNFTLAGQYADTVINESGLAMTEATPYNSGNFYNPQTVTNPYRKMWSDVEGNDGTAYQGEIIWGLVRIPPNDGEVANIFYTNSTRLTGAPLHDMGRNLFNLMNDANGDGNPANDYDIRRRAFIDPSSIIAANPATVGNWKSGDVLCIDKYPGKVGAGAALTNNLKVFRLTEMYLIKAEAYAAAGAINGASESTAAILKQIRDVRTYNPVGIRPLPVYGSATEAWADILTERRVELCFEGHRYVDIRRLGGLAGGVTQDRYYRDCDDFNVPVCSLPLSDHRWILPIPIDEIIGNPAIQPNPGY
jgi:hypothetical protein